LTSPRLMEVVRRRGISDHRGRYPRRVGRALRDDADHNAIIGESVSRFLYATGFSGRGVPPRPRSGRDPARPGAGPPDVRRPWAPSASTRPHFDRSTTWC